MSDPDVERTLENANKLLAPRVVADDFLEAWWQRTEALREALRMQAANYRQVKRGEDAEYCWCRFADWTVNEKCEDQPQCRAAREALAQRV